MTHSQSAYQVRFETGLRGAEAIAEGADVIVIIDVLSFTTTLDLALAAGIEVFPSAPDAAAEVAARHGAALAGPRGEGVGLSPSSIAGVAPRRMVIPSPNGSAIAAAFAAHPATVVAASLRNRSAVASWLLERQGDKGDRFMIAIVAAGETWDSGQTRFAVEDLLAAGALVDALADVGIDYCSPEAAAAAAAFTGLRNATGHLIGASSSGRELSAGGFRADIDLAIAIDESTIVPVLREFSFRQ